MGFSISWNGYGVWIEELSKLVLGIPKEEVLEASPAIPKQAICRTDRLSRHRSSGHRPKDSSQTVCRFCGFRGNGKEALLGPAGWFRGITPRSTRKKPG